MSLTCDPSRIVSALLLVEQVTGRTCEQSLNRAGLHTIIGSGSYKGAMQLTPKASRAQIAALSDAMIRGSVVKKLKAAGRWPMKSSEIAILVRKERKRRIAAIGYAAYAGYSNAAKSFGGRGVKGVNSDFNRSAAAAGRGRKATATNLVAEITNTATAIERIGQPALQQALDNAARDLEDYAHKKMQQNFDRVNP